jgi:hypothetical protein
VREHVHRRHSAQPIAGLDKLGRVRGERRRVARDVDDSLRLALDHAADDLLREPGARRIHHHDVGRPGLLKERPDAQADVLGGEAGVLDPVSPGVVLGVRDRLGHGLDSPYLRGVPGKGEPDRPDPAVEVEDALAAAQPGGLAREPAEAIGHLGVGLEEGERRDAEPEPGDRLLEEFLAEHSGGPRRATARALDDRVQVHGRPAEARGRRDEPRLDLAAAPALTDDEIPEHARLRARVICGDRLLARPLANLVARAVVRLAREVAVLRVDDLRPAAAPVEAEDELHVAPAERVLELVAVAPLLDRRHDWIELEGIEAPEAPQRLVDLAGLLLELLLVGQSLPRGAGAGLAVVHAPVGDPARAGLEHLQDAGLAVAALGLGQPDPHGVTRKRAGDEDHVPVGARDAAPALGQ